MTDTDALQRYARNRDPEAFAYLVGSYQQMVYAACFRRLGHESDARDATQETFLKLARSAGDIGQSGGSVVGWLHRCAATTSIDLIRRESRRRARERAAASPEQDDVSGSDWNQVREALDEALTELPDAERDLVVQRYLVGRPQSEMAREAGVSASMMSRRVRAAVDKLRDRLNAKGFGVGAAVLVMGLTRESAVALPVGLSTSLSSVGVVGVGGKPVSGAGLAWLSKIVAVIFAAGGVTTAGVVGYQEFIASERSVPKVVTSVSPPASASAPTLETSTPPPAEASEAAGPPDQPAFFVYVMGNADRPGAFAIPADAEYSLIQFLASSGSLEGVPKGRPVRLIRRIADDQEAQIFNGTVGDLQAGGRELIYLQPDDLVVMGSDD